MRQQIPEFAERFGRNHRLFQGECCALRIEHPTGNRTEGLVGAFTDAMLSMPILHPFNNTERGSKKEGANDGKRWQSRKRTYYVCGSKCRRKVVYGGLRRYVGEISRRLGGQKESRIEEGHLLPYHVHMMIAISPKYAVSQVIGYIKGKSAIHLARVYGERKRDFVTQPFWARGFFVSTVGRDEEAVREYICNQGQEDKRLDQMGLW
jgi:putative transposase